MISLLFVTSAWAQTCDPVGLYGVLEELPAPAVIVLGERKGTPLDLRRAKRLVGTLLRRGDPVTLAFEAVERDRQPALDALMDGQATLLDLPETLAFEDRWRFSFAPYEDLFAFGVEGIPLVAAGLPYGLKPADAIAPVPPGYSFQLSETMGEGPAPVELEETLTAAMAWRSFAIAEAAISSWDGHGYLVIVADRALVEGGLGVQWQAQRQTEAQVRAAVLSWAESPCYTGDLVWRDLLGR